MTAMQKAQLKFGKTLDWSLEARQSPRQEEDEERIRAVECLVYVRDVLMSSDGDGIVEGIDVSRLTK